MNVAQLPAWLVDTRARDGAWDAYFRERPWWPAAKCAERVIVLVRNRSRSLLVTKAERVRLNTELAAELRVVAGVLESIAVDLLRPEGITQ